MDHTDRQSRAWLKLFNTQHRFPSDKTLFLAFTSLEQDASEVCADRVPKRSTLFSMAIPTMPGPRIKGLPTFMVTPTPRKTRANDSTLSTLLARVLYSFSREYR